MNERKTEKNIKGKITFIFIILILAVVLILGIIAGKTIKEQSNTLNENTSNSTSNTDNTKVEFKPASYVIQFNSDLLGEKFELSDNEIKNSNYEISFLDNNKFDINMEFGNHILGTYTISNNIINCTLTSASGEYSQVQEIKGNISFKINSNSEIEIVNIPKDYTIKTSTLGDSGWELTNETKQMEFWPLVKGIKYIINQ